MKEKFYLTTPIYYASGKPHVGHAFTTVYADVLARYKFIQNNEVFFATGTDEHGAKIAEIASKSNQTPQEFVDFIAGRYTELWRKLEIHYSDFIRTTSEKHKNAVKVFISMLQKEDIYEDYYEGLYCIGCESFITEKNLVNGLCPDHLRAPEPVKERNYFFKLENYLPVIKEKILHDELIIEPENAKNEILSIIEEGLPNFSISREKVKWGIPYPGDESQKIYVWVEALINYVSILGFPDSENYKKFWPADLHIIGAEINKFHSIFWPALLLSAQQSLPKKIWVHGLFTVNGQKMSKTIGNIIDPLEMLRKFGADATRYLLLSQFSASQHGDIKEGEFLIKYNSDLAHGVGNLFERVFTMVNNYISGQVLENFEPDESLTEVLRDIEKDYHQEMNNLDLFNGLKNIFKYIKELDVYISRKQPWVMHKELDPKLPHVLGNALFGIDKVIDFLLPFMPGKMAAARTYFEKLVKGEFSKQPEKLGIFPRL